MCRPPRATTSLCSDSTIRLALAKASCHCSSVASSGSISSSFKTHKKFSEQLLDLDSKVAEAVAKLKAKGFVSPYLKAFVVARINPLRWIQGEPPPLEEVLKTMRDRAAKFNVDKIRQEDIVSTGGAPDDSD